MRVQEGVSQGFERCRADEGLRIRCRLSSSALWGAAELHEQGAPIHRAQAECPPGGPNRQWQDVEFALLRPFLAVEAEKGRVSYCTWLNAHLCADMPQGKGLQTAAESS